MSGDAIGIKSRTEFFWASRYDGDRDPRPVDPALPTDPEELRRCALDFQSRLKALQADLTDPKCVVIIAGGDGLQKSIWRKVDGLD